MNRIAQLLMVLLLALAGLAAGYLFGRDRQADLALELEQTTMFAQPRALPEFSLVDHDEQPFGPARLQEGWSLLFFGFTHCPDVCPSTLATLAAARRELADLPEARRPRIVLVSVDPARDTPAALKAYVNFFDPGFIGVTGSEVEIADLAARMGVAVRVGPEDDEGYYSVDHTAALFLVNPEGSLVAILSTPHTPDGIAHDYRLIVDAAGGRA